MEKSVRALTSFMGIVYAGRFYTYISPEQPAARIRQILEVLQPDCVIADSESADDGKLEDFPAESSIMTNYAGRRSQRKCWRR